MLNPHTYLESKGYINTRGAIDGYTGSVIYNLPDDVAQRIQDVLGLEEIPDIAVVKNGKVIDQSSAIEKRDSCTPLVYSLFLLENFKEAVISTPIHGERIVCLGQSFPRANISTSIVSSRNDFETVGGLYIHKRKLKLFQKTQNGK